VGPTLDLLEQADGPWMGLKIFLSGHFNGES